MTPPESVAMELIRYRMRELVVPARSTRLDSWVGTNVVVGKHVVSSSPQCTSCSSHRILAWPSPGFLNWWTRRHCSTRRQARVPVLTCVVMLDTFWVEKKTGE